ncbi:dihydrodipicolinate synthase family protein [Deinococcus deserti]|uniref:Putative dihydrodipicolinate synthase n=1 Tax=Deinococcus deserti (strain DSM 17065 / CIP 109153 / LMG 22923 / VCD115) TaxID=546414 RepID=C1D433_DEIDV|nr:dihydrodipicolinate synthase family protein [Deinococcus deserti]ACO47914.1 putative dihydrodipicolinate synthase [Deinococcus deserti VCD115]
MTHAHSSAFHVRGLVVPIVTPYTPHGAVDLKQAEALARFYALQGVPALFPGGTTGEFALLTLDEREALLEAVVRGVRSSGTAETQIIAHTGAATLDEVLRLSRHAQAQGVPAVAVVTPFYYEYEDAAVLAFYQTVCRTLPDLGVYAYTIPQRAGNSMTASSVAELCREPNFAGIKDSSGDMHRLLTLIEVPGLSVLAGADDLCFPFMISGGHGLVSGPAGVVPELFQAFFAALNTQQVERAMALARHIRVFSRIIRGGGRIDYLKAGLDWRGLTNGPSRQPLPNMGAEERRALTQQLVTFAQALAGDGVTLTSAAVRDAVV